MNGNEDHTANTDKTLYDGYHDTRYVNIYPVLIWYLQARFLRYVAERSPSRHGNGADKCDAEWRGQNTTHT
jgi:hypothetical protein